MFFRVKPATLRVYLHSLAGFLQFLAGSRPWLRHVDLTSSQLLTVYGKVKNIAKSPIVDVLKDKVERHARGDDKLDLEPAQVAAYLDSSRVQRVRQLLEESAGRQLSRAERTDLRNCLALQILLANAKRAGDVTHLRRQAIIEAESRDGKDNEVEVSTALNNKGNNKITELRTIFQRESQNTQSKKKYIYITTGKLG